MNVRIVIIGQNGNVLIILVIELMINFMRIKIAIKIYIIFYKYYGYYSN